MRNEHGKPPAQTAEEFFELVRDSQVDEVLALADPQIICHPLARPGLSEYYGHDGLTALVRDLHTIFGRYQIEITKITEAAGGSVIVHATIRPEPGEGRPEIRSGIFTFTFRNGLIASVDSSMKSGPSQ
jgi:hypothetical protein